MEINIIAKKVGMFTGKIILSADGIEKKIPIIIKVETENVLFDIKLNIPNNKLIYRGTLLTDITLQNMGIIKKVDVYVT